MRAVLLAVFIFAATEVNAQIIMDGDTLRAGGVTYRLHGIGAPERSQVCVAAWPAGRLAASALQGLISGRQVACEALGRDRYGRTIGRCFAGGVDLGAEMVRRGWAWAYRKYSLDYVPEEDLARADGLGVHKHGCVPDWEYRAQRKRSVSQPAP